MEVTLENGKVITIAKLPLGKYADLLKAFQEFPKHIGEFKEFKSFSNSQILAALPAILGSCMPDVIRIIEIASPLVEEEIQQLGLTEVTDILMAIYKVNNYQAIYEKIKKVIAQPSQVQNLEPEVTTTPAN